MITCPVCTGSKVLPYFVKSGYEYARCFECKCIFLSEMPGTVRDFYNQQYFVSASGAPESGYVDYEVDKEVMNDFFNNEISQLKMLVGAGAGRLLDIGAASGHFIELARKADFAAEGIDVSPDIISVAQANGRDVIFGELGALENSFLTERRGRYNVITMWDSIEHLVDLQRAFDEIDQLFDAHGLLLVATPDAGSIWARIFGRQWHSYVPPEHTIFFTKKTIRTFLTSRGYQVITVKTIHKRFTLQYVVNVLYRWKRIGLLVKLLAFLERHPKLARLPFKLYIGDNMLVVARKK